MIFFFPYSYNKVKIDFSLVVLDLFILYKLRFDYFSVPFNQEGLKGKTIYLSCTLKVVAEVL